MYLAHKQIWIHIIQIMVKVQTVYTNVNTTFHHAENHSYHNVSSSHLNLGSRNRQMTWVSGFRVPALDVCSTKFEFLKREYKGQRESAFTPHERRQGASNGKLNFYITILCKVFQQHFSARIKRETCTSTPLLVLQPTGYFHTQMWSPLNENITRKYALRQRLIRGEGRNRNPRLKWKKSCGKKYFILCKPFAFFIFVCVWETSPCMQQSWTWDNKGTALKPKYTVCFYGMYRQCHSLQLTHFCMLCYVTIRPLLHHIPRDSSGSLQLMGCTLEFPKQWQLPNTTKMYADDSRN